MKPALKMTQITLDEQLINAVKQLQVIGKNVSNYVKTTRFVTFSFG